MSAVVAVFVATTTVLDARRERAFHRHELEQRGLLLADTLNEVLADPLYFTNIDELDDFATVVAGRPDVQFVRIYGRDARLLIDTQQPDYPVGLEGNEFVKQAVDSRRTLLDQTDEWLEVAAPIVAGRDVLGVAHVSYGLEAVEAEIRTATVQRVWRSLAIVLIGVVVSFGVAQYFVRPIRRLVTATGKVAAGDLKFEPNEKRNDEIGDLSQAFEQMTESIRQSRETLDERARDLASSNERLELEVDERKRIEAELHQSRTRIVEVAESLRREISHNLHGSLQNKIDSLVKTRFEEVPAL